MRHPEKRLRSLETEKEVLEKSSKGQMSRCGEQKKAVGMTVGNLVKSVVFQFIGKAIYISRAILKWYPRRSCEQDLFSEDLRRDCTGRSEQSFTGVIYIGTGERVVPLDQSSLVGVSI